MASILAVRKTNTVNVTTAGGTVQVDDLSIVLPASGAARTVRVSAIVSYGVNSAVGNGYILLLVYLDGALYLPNGTYQPQSEPIGGVRQWENRIKGVPVVIPGDSATHTLQVMYQLGAAAGWALTMQDRSLTILDTI